MSQGSARAQDFEGLRQDWEAVGGYMSAAIQDVALELGGEELAGKVALAAVSDGVLPNPDALKLLKDLHPESPELVRVRTGQIQEEAHQRKLDELPKATPRSYGKTILNALTSFDFFEISHRRRKSWS